MSAPAAYSAETLRTILDRLDVSRKGRELRAHCKLCGHNSLFLNPGRQRPLLASCGHCGRDKQKAVLEAAGLTSADLGPPMSTEEIKTLWAEVNPDAIIDEKGAGNRIPLASASLRNAVYGWLLRRPECQLSDAHAKWLEERGLPKNAAVAAGYGSTPDEASAIRIAVDALRIWGTDLYKVPGFYAENGEARLNVKDQGIWHPCRNIDGEICALKIRRPLAQKDYRMSTLSASKYGGPIADMVIHVPLGALASDNSTVWVTEGERKADVVYRHKRVPIIGLPGVQHVGRVLAMLRPLGCQKVIAAFDADPAGELAAAKLIEAVVRDGDKFDIEFTKWEVGTKPSKEDAEADPKNYRPKVDDAIVAGSVVEVVTAGHPYIQEMLRRQSEKGDAPLVRRGSLGITADEILSMSFPPKRFAVERMTAEGLNVVVGRPKSGKTIFLFQKAICVAAGYNFVGHKTRQGHVLYIALEDTLRRIEDRLRGMGMEAYMSEATNYLKFEPAERWLKYRNRQLPILKSYINEMGGDLIYVVVDTLQRWRSLETEEATKNPYAADSTFMGNLWNLANDTSTPMDFVHHSRKGSTGDYINDSSGTQGIAGGCDSMTLFTRKDHCNYAKIASNGRDVDEAEKYVVWDKELRWFYAVTPDEVPEIAKGPGEVAEDSKGPSVGQLICHSLLRRGVADQKTLLADIMAVRPATKTTTLTATITRLKNDGLIQSEGRGDKAVYFAAAGKVGAG